MNIDLIMENARLQGRVITLEAEVKCLEAVIRSHERVDCLSVTGLKKQLTEADAENARLKAAVDRLTKAGNAMADAIYEADPEKLEAHKKFKLTEEEYNAVQLWNAAKEGKQS